MYTSSRVTSICTDLSKIIIRIRIINHIYHSSVACRPLLCNYTEMAVCNIIM